VGKVRKVRPVRREVVAAAPTKKRALPNVPRPLAAPPEREEGGRVARESAGAVVRRATQADAFARIVDPWRKQGFGYRAFLVGASGTGKTWFSRALIDYTIASGAAEWAFVYDHKDPKPGFDGLQRRDVADFLTRPPEATDPSVVVFHEDAPGEPDEVSDLAMSLGIPALVDVDECFPDLVSDGGQKFRNGATCPSAMLLRTGRSRCVSGIFGTQMPQEIPTAIMDLCESTVVFRLQARGLNYMARDERIPPHAVSVVRGLKVGEFIIISEGAWDGVVYGPT
jgi:hypothetical protein